MKKIILLMILFVISAQAVVTTAQDVPVSSTIQNADPNNVDPVTGLAKDYRIKSDGRGVYLNKVDSVVSIIQGIGDWELNTQSSSVRKVFVDLRDPVLDSMLNGGQTPNAPFQTTTAPTRFISKCTQQGLKMQNLLPGSSVLCPLAISVKYSGSTYAIRLHPDNQNYVADWVQWTCLLTNSSGKCNSWEMTPSTIYDGERKARGQLLKITTSNGKTVETKLGVFYFSFKVNLTNP